MAFLNPTIEKPTREQRTVSFSYQQYAQLMNISRENAYGALVKATRNLMTRTVEVRNPLVKGFEIFQWTNYAKFSSEKLELVFSEDILPYLFQLKKFIKYNLEHVKFFENKYSMRIYEWLLKELTQKKTHMANIEISLEEFKFMLVLENNYPEFKRLNQWVLKPIAKDLNAYSNIKLAIDKRGRPVDTLIFQCELDKQIDLVSEIAKKSATEDDLRIPKTAHSSDQVLHGQLKETLHDALTSKIQLNSFEAKFLSDMQSKFDLNGSFSWLTQKQRTTLGKILAKYRRS